MAKIKWLLVLTLFLGFQFAKAQTPPVVGGVEFFHGTLVEAMAKAKAENKLLYIDSYTAWCGPCKWFAANVLTDAEVGTMFNEKFINYKLDIEKGEGPAFATQNSIVSIPTMFFLDGNGKVISKKVGSQQKIQFLDWGRQMSEFKL